MNDELEALKRDASATRGRLLAAEALIAALIDVLPEKTVQDLRERFRRHIGVAESAALSVPNQESLHKGLRDATVVYLELLRPQ